MINTHGPISPRASANYENFGSVLSAHSAITPYPADFPGDQESVYCQIGGADTDAHEQVDTNTTRDSIMTTTTSGLGENVYFDTNSSAASPFEGEHLVPVTPSAISTAVFPLDIDIGAPELVFREED